MNYEPLSDELERIGKEIVDSAKNQMRYNAFITMLNNNFRNLKTAMRSV